MQAWRIEASASDDRIPGGKWQSSIWMESRELAMALMGKTGAIKCREDWYAFRKVVMKEAQRLDVRCWRTMLGERDVLHAPAPTFGR